MAERKMTVFGAVVLGALLAGPVGAAGVATPASMPDMGGRAHDSAGGPPIYPSLNQPASVPDANPSQTGRQDQSPKVRDSRNTPSPITPGNVSDANPSASTHDRTNDGGMGIGGTR